MPVGALLVGSGDLQDAQFVERFSKDLQANR
jgi:hypothetical protein